MLALGSQLETVAPPVAPRPQGDAGRTASNGNHSNYRNGRRQPVASNNAQPTTSTPTTPSQNPPTSNGSASNGNTSGRAAPKKPDVCKRCQKKGHWMSECPAPAPVARVNQVGKPKKDAATPESKTSESLEVVASVHTPGSRSSGNGRQ